MATTIFVHYRGARARALHTGEAVSAYLRDFVYDDLEMLGFPQPRARDCVCVGQAGMVRCGFPRASLELDARLALAFEALRAVDLEDLSIAMVRLSLKSEPGSEDLYRITATKGKQHATRSRAMPPGERDRGGHPYDSRTSRSTRGSSAYETPSRARPRIRVDTRRSGVDEGREMPARAAHEVADRPRAEGRSLRDRLSGPESGCRRRAGSYAAREDRRIDNVLERLNDIHSAVASGPSTSLSGPGRPIQIPSSSIAEIASLNTEAPSQRPARVPIPPTPASPEKIKIEPRTSTSPSLSWPSSAIATRETATLADPRPSPTTTSSPPTSTASSVFSQSDAAASSASSAGSPGCESRVDADDVRRELREVRRSMAECAAREGVLVKRLEGLRALEDQGASQDEGAARIPAIPEDLSTLQASQNEIQTLRAQLQTALAERHTAAHALYREHQLRVAAENALADVRREGCVTVVPALVEAFVRISAMSDGLVREDAVWM